MNTWTGFFFHYAATSLLLEGQPPAVLPLCRPALERAGFDRIRVDEASFEVRARARNGWMVDGDIKVRLVVDLPGLVRADIRSRSTFRGPVAFITPSGGIPGELIDRFVWGLRYELWFRAQADPWRPWGARDRLRAA